MVQAYEKERPLQSSHTDSIGQKVVNAAKRRFMPGIIERSTKELYMQSGFENIDLLKKPLEEGNVLWVLLSHESLGDLGPAVAVANKVQERFPQLKGFRYVLSKTIGGGEQGAETQSSFQNGGKQLFERNNIHVLEVASDNDIQNRGATQSRQDTRNISIAMSDPEYGILLHPEANMNAGRINPEIGEKNGTGLMDGNVKTIVGHALKKGLRVVVLPVGLYGSSNVYDPVTRRITQEGKDKIMQAEIARLIGDPYYFPETIGFIKVEKPFLLQDIKDCSDPFYEIMLRIAKGVPPQGRGEFKDVLRGVR